MTIQAPIGQSNQGKQLCIGPNVLNHLMPLHVVLSMTGHILHLGATLDKVMRPAPQLGQRFLEVFQILRPSGIETIAELQNADGLKLHLVSRGGDKTAFKGVAVADAVNKTITINLSFGIGVIDAVRKFRLTSGDFAPNDLTVEMLYLVEAKSAAMDESRKLNERLQGAMIAAQEKAYTDGLTGLKNRRAMDYLLEHALQKDAGCAVMNIDLDFFKAVNDTLGHAAGDHVLMQVSDILSDHFRDADTIARVGGDEFVALLPNAGTPEVMMGLATSLIKRIEEPIPYGGQSCKISASIGIAMRPKGMPISAQALCHNADIALYASKRQGRAQATVFSDELPKLVSPDPANPA